MSPYLNTLPQSLPQSRMFSSLSKLPLPRENSTSRRSRSHKQHEKPSFNPNYLRPLTPQVMPSSTSAHGFESAKRREEYADRQRQRPQSAMEYSYSRPHGNHHDGEEFLDLLAQRAGLTISPPHSSSSDRSRQELQASLHKLLLETGNLHEDNSDQENVFPDGHVSYHKQFVATKNKILKHRQTHGSELDHLQDDFGVYGDDDEDENDVDDTQQEVKPMKLLPDTHRPKIMVPRWRQNASPHPPSYSQSLANSGRKSTDTEATLAASLAQSLFDSGQTAARGIHQRENSLSSPKQPAEGTRVDHGKGNLKRKTPGKSVESPRKETHSPLPSDDVAVSKSIDGSPNRPSNLPLHQSNNVRLREKKGLANGHVSADSQGSDLPKRNSVTKLSDVIAYTADCIEKKDMSYGVREDSDHEEETLKISDIPSSPLTVTDILEDNSMKVSSVDSVVGSPTELSDSKEYSPVNTGTDGADKNKAGTDSVVFYFQNRDKINQENANKTDASLRSPTFINMEKTSTPKTEYKSFAPKDAFSNFAKKGTGRLVREDNVKSPTEDSDKANKQRLSSTDDDNSDGTSKERVLKAVDQLRMSFERKKQLSEERRQKSVTQPLTSGTPTTPVSPTTVVPIQKQFNEISTGAKTGIPGAQKPLPLRTFSPPPYTQTSQPTNTVESEDSSGGQGHQTGSSGQNGFDQNEQRHRLYKKVGQNKFQFQSDIASARQIQHKMDRASSPSCRTPSPVNLNSPYEKMNNNTSESSQLMKPKQKGNVASRSSFEGSLIPQRSKSPTRASIERERPKSSMDFVKQDSKDAPTKSSMKDTKIPVLKKSSSGHLSKSSEDISKLKKKSAFKDQLKNIFGRKK